MQVRITPNKVILLVILSMVLALSISEISRRLNPPPPLLRPAAERGVVAKQPAVAEAANSSPAEKDFLAAAKPASTSSIPGADIDIGPGGDPIYFAPQSRIAIIVELADRYDLNVAMRPGLGGTTALAIKSGTWRDAFDAILEPAGFTYYEDHKIIRIVPK